MRISRRMVTLALLAASTAHAGSEDFEGLMRTQVQTLVQDEYNITFRLLQRELSAAVTRVKGLEVQQGDAVIRAQAQSKVDAQGMELLKQFDQLLATRYVDKHGKFQAGLEVTPKDVDGVNDLFTAHLSMSPLSGRVSAGQARKTIEWGLSRLDDLKSVHASPNEANNSELEIIAKQMKDEQIRIEKVNGLAESLKLKLDPDATLTAEAAAALSDQRTPASDAPKSAAQRLQRKR